MEIYVGNFPDDFVAFDLRRLFNEVLKGGLVRFFTKVDVAAEAKFIIIEEQKETGKYRYGVVTIESDELARLCIEKLNNRIVRSRPISVREYRSRTCMNERRALNWRDKPWHGPERRKKDRRNKKYLESGPQTRKDDIKWHG
ncbi:MAG: hypothetical protein A2V90_01365 [Gammaproteobacteria bacterium RBG_16_57_12]|nr:MAG: hypothetical protein A2V90_01365 [Gammaproteobacteria bacterium RBG_16_57_12]